MHTHTPSCSPPFPRLPCLPRLPRSVLSLLSVSLRPVPSSPFLSVLSKFLAPSSSLGERSLGGLLPPPSPLSLALSTSFSHGCARVQSPPSALARDVCGCVRAQPPCSIYSLLLCFFGTARNITREYSLLVCLYVDIRVRASTLARVAPRRVLPLTRNLQPRHIFLLVSFARKSFLAFSRILYFQTVITVFFR